MAYRIIRRGQRRARRDDARFRKLLEQLRGSHSWLSLRLSDDARGRGKFWAVVPGRFGQAASLPW